MHFASFASLLAISASVVLANADAVNPSVNLVRADNPTVSLPRSGFAERRAAIAALKPRQDVQAQCNAATGFFSTARCVLRRGKVVAGPAVTYATATLNSVVTDVWKQIVNTANQSGLLQSKEYANGDLYIYATSGYPGAPQSCTWPSLNAAVSPADLYTTLMQAVLDAQTNGGINRYYLADQNGNVLASLMIKASPKS
ncbi:hypothetical protein GGS26DRAFT_599776 [Hypomontagnella submonticulosa]|nr:hypothetical protein GGS26DRAFT_599776 [Hypomontagnella submonticulosa]